MKTLKNGPQKLFVIGPKIFSLSSPAQPTSHIPQPTAQNWFFILWNLGTRHLFSYLWFAIRLPCSQSDVSSFYKGQFIDFTHLGGKKRGFFFVCAHKLWLQGKPILSKKMLNTIILRGIFFLLKHFLPEAFSRRRSSIFSGKISNVMLFEQHL